MPGLEDFALKEARHGLEVIGPVGAQVGVLVGLSVVFGAVALTLFHFRQCHYRDA